MSLKQGILYIIASPIGNLEDFTIRAINTLKESTDIVFCEDTRRTKKLLNHYGINIKTQSLHEHSSKKKINFAIKLLKDGISIAYLTDSGTPGISDPGSKLIQESRQNNIKIIPLPGPSAQTSIISVSGFSANNIYFAGFLSKKDGKRKRELEKLKEYKSVIIIYESPYRIKKLLKTIANIFPKSDIIIGREMTKIHEEFLCGNISDILNNIDNIKELGEFTVAIDNSK